MLSVDDALHKILAQVSPTEKTETIPLAQAFRRVLAETLTANVDVPPADNSAMDGYAIHTDALKKNQNQLVVSQRIPAGQAPQPLEKNTAARIFTGSEIPAGANAVVMQENVEQNGNTISILSSPKAGDHIRERGQDIAKGSTLFSRGHVLGAADLGVIASTGIDKVSVYKRLTVGVLTTGDELVSPDKPLSPGQIYNSNHFTLGGLLSSIGIDMIDLGHIPDSLDETVTALKKASRSADIILTTGGVSVGEEDHIKPAIEKIGSINVWKLAIKPGKPLAFGEIAGTPFFGLPGNPVSVLVTFLIIVRPYLSKAQGNTQFTTDTFFLPSNFSFSKNTTRQEYLRVRVEDGKLHAFNNQSSGVLSSASWANALAIVPMNTDVNEGDQLETLLFSQLGI